MSDSLRKTLDLAPIVNTNLPTVIESVDLSDQEKLKDDLDYARDTMYLIIEKGKDALEDLYDVARQSQHPNSYNALTQLLKGMADMSKDLVEIQRKKKELTGQSEDTPRNVTNNLFVGTTSDLNKLIEDERNSQ